MRNLLALIGLIALLYLGWQFRDKLPWRWAHHDDAAATVSPEAAASAERKLARMVESGDTVHLTGAEFTSYLRYKFHDQIAGQLEDPTISFAGDTLTVRGRFPTSRLPDTREIRAVRDFLPDTAEVKLRGELRTLGQGRAALKIDNVSFAKVPVPRDVYPDALKRLGRPNDPALAADEYPFRLPPRVGSAKVEGGELVLAPG